MSIQVKPVCVRCKREMKVAMNGVHVLFNATFGPYVVQSADVWECTDCGATIATGWGSHPFSQHFEPDFAEAVASCDVVVPA